MSAVVLDTHAWVWSLTGDERLSSAAAAVILGADSVLVSPISFFEIAQKVRIGKWPEMEPFVESLPRLLSEQGGHVAPLTPEISVRAGIMTWDHRDPFDRILAATALLGNMAVVSADAVLDSLPDVIRLW